MDKPVEIHASGIVTFQMCPRRWYVTERLGWQPPVPDPALMIGDVVHHALERYYYHSEDLIDAFESVKAQRLAEFEARLNGMLWEAVRPTLEPHFDLCQGLLSGYQLWVAYDNSDTSDSNYIVVKVETEFKFVHEGVLYAGRRDGVMRHKKTGELYVFEHKTARNAQECIDGLPWDFQPVMYAWATELELKEPVKGVLYNVIQKTNPWDIPILDSGLPSRAQRVLDKTCEAVYLDVLLRCAAEIGMNPTDAKTLYADALQRLRMGGPHIYHRVLLPRYNKYAIDHIRAAAAMMLEAAKAGDEQGPGAVYPSRSRFNCPRCPIKNACLAMDYGQADFEGILEGQGLWNKYASGTLPICADFS